MSQGMEDSAPKKKPGRKKKVDSQSAGTPARQDNKATDSPPDVTTATKPARRSATTASNRGKRRKKEVPLFEDTPPGVCLCLGCKVNEMQNVRTEPKMVNSGSTLVGNKTTPSDSRADSFEATWPGVGDILVNDVAQNTFPHKPETNSLDICKVPVKKNARKPPLKGFKFLKLVSKEVNKSLRSGHVLKRKRKALDRMMSPKRRLVRKSPRRTTIDYKGICPRRRRSSDESSYGLDSPDKISNRSTKVDHQKIQALKTVTKAINFEENALKMIPPQKMDLGKPVKTYVNKEDSDSCTLILEYFEPVSDEERNSSVDCSEIESDEGSVLNVNTASTRNDSQTQEPDSTDILTRCGRSTDPKKNRKDPLMSEKDNESSLDSLCSSRQSVMTSRGTSLFTGTYQDNSNDSDRTQITAFELNSVDKNIDRNFGFEDFAFNTQIKRDIIASFAAASKSKKLLGPKSHKEKVLSESLKRNLCDGAKRLHIETESELAEPDSTEVVKGKAFARTKFETSRLNVLRSKEVENNKDFVAEFELCCREPIFTNNTDLLCDADKNKEVGEIPNLSSKGNFDVESLSQNVLEKSKVDTCQNEVKKKKTNRIGPKCYKDMLLAKKFVEENMATFKKGKMNNSKEKLRSESQMTEPDSTDFCDGPDKKKRKICCAGKCSECNSINFGTIETSNNHQKNYSSASQSYKQNQRVDTAEVENECSTKNAIVSGVDSGFPNFEENKLRKVANNGIAENKYHGSSNNITKTMEENEDKAKKSEGNHLGQEKIDASTLGDDKMERNLPRKTFRSYSRNCFKNIKTNWGKLDKKRPSFSFHSVIQMYRKKIRMGECQENNLGITGFNRPEIEREDQNCSRTNSDIQMPESEKKKEENQLTTGSLNCTISFESNCAEIDKNEKQDKGMLVETGEEITEGEKQKSGESIFGHSDAISRTKHEDDQPNESFPLDKCKNLSDFTEIKSCLNKKGNKLKSNPSRSKNKVIPDVVPPEMERDPDGGEQNVDVRCESRQNVCDSEEIFVKSTPHVKTSDISSGDTNNESIETKGEYEFPVRSQNKEADIAESRAVNDGRKFDEKNEDGKRPDKKITVGGTADVHEKAKKFKGEKVSEKYFQRNDQNISDAPALEGFSKEEKSKFDISQNEAANSPNIEEIVKNRSKGQSSLKASEKSHHVSEITVKARRRNDQNNLSSNRTSEKCQNSTLFSDDESCENQESKINRCKISEKGRKNSQVFEKGVREKFGSKPKTSKISENRTNSSRVSEENITKDDRGELKSSEQCPDVLENNLNRISNSDNKQKPCEIPEKSPDSSTENCKNHATEQTTNEIVEKCQNNHTGVSEEKICKNAQSKQKTGENCQDSFENIVGKISRNDKIKQKSGKHEKLQDSSKVSSSKIDNSDGNEKCNFSEKCQNSSEVNSKNICKNGKSEPKSSLERCQDSSMVGVHEIDKNNAEYSSKIDPKSKNVKNEEIKHKSNKIAENCHQSSEIQHKN